MDLINVLFVIALIYFFSSIQKRKKAGRREEERTEAPQTPEPRSPEAGRTPGQTYDYGEFRKKLRRAWKLPEEKEEGGENTAPCPAEPAQEDTEPAESVKVPLRVQKTQGNEEQEREILRRQAEYLAYAAKTESVPEKETIPEQTLSDTAKEARRWTEEDVKRWIVYDAVFGEPRSRRPWKEHRAGGKHA